MKTKGLHEGCIEQMVRLYYKHLFSGHPLQLDKKGRIRLDDYEMSEDVQQAVSHLWEKIDAGNIQEIADIDGLKAEFLRHHGFGMPDVDYSREVDPIDL
jgi:enoyl-[acyl-carrier protein] reductase/trans-2-enoyl-CoA reductase (NAD+)